MNTRLLGTLCIIGSLIWMADGVRMAMLRLMDFDLVSTAAILVWAIGGLCGMLGLIALKATGTNPILRLLSYLPAAGFLTLSVGACLRLLGIFPNPEGNWVSGIGWLLILSGLVLVGILTLAAKTWTGWRKLTPLLIIIALPVAAAFEKLTGLSGLATVLPGAAFVLLGYVVQNGPPIAQLREAVA